ncbi:MAG: CinA family protein [Alphaproteobacteria bacterium]|nr:CinA family protein [Alphaproteobacteria bacterium]
MLYSLSNTLIEKATGALITCRQSGLRLATAESCTGGLIAATLTEIAGSSDVVDRGFVTYSNEAKSEMLGVPADLISRHGAVSREVAEAMAAGALANSAADIAVSVTGVAGPGGATPTKPVGLVFVGGARSGGTAAAIGHRFAGDRNAVREQALVAALNQIEILATDALP